MDLLHIQVSYTMLRFSKNTFSTLKKYISSTVSIMFKTITLGLLNLIGKTLNLIVAQSAEIALQKMFAELFQMAAD